MIVKVPAPDKEGEKTLPLTPVPENTPPVGDPVSVILLLAVVNGPYVPALTVGKGFTVKERMAKESHPTELVRVEVKVPVVLKLVPFQLTGTVLTHLFILVTLDVADLMVAVTGVLVIELQLPEVVLACAKNVVVADIFCVNVVEPLNNNEPPVEAENQSTV